MQKKAIVILFWGLICHRPIFAELAGLDACQLTDILELPEPKTSSQTMVSFDYTNENLVNIINRLAAIQNINILYPADLSKLEIEVSLNLSEKISLEEAWKLVNTFLEIAGFSLVPRAANYEIVANKDSNKEPLKTYINIYPERLPNDDSKIRYLYYLQNINLSSPNSKGKANLELILKDLLTGPAGSINHLFDLKTNSLILTNKTSNIKAAMNIIMNLDQEGFRESIEVVSLKYTNAKNVAESLNKIIDNKKGSSAYRYNSTPAASTSEEELYFSKNTSIVPIERSNSIAIMGKVDAVEKIKNFIIKYLDVPAEGGKSIIHTKDLQHVDAGELAKVLQKIIKAKTENSQSATQNNALSEVIITAEQDEQIEQIKQLDIKKNGVPQTKSDQKGTSIAGNNCLIIAAREPEWQILEKLIDEIDVPQQQVAFEALIIDLIVSDNTLLSSQTRNLNGTGRPQGADFQSAQIGGTAVPNQGTNGPVLNYAPITIDGVTSYIPTPQGLASNLITAGTLDEKGNPIVNQIVKAVNASATGSTLISFSDGNGIASLLELFTGYQNAKILSEPFVTTRNHQQAAMSSYTERVVEGSVQEQSVGGPAIIKRDIIKADLKIDVLPRISKEGVINLEIIVHASEFQNSASITDNTILTRKIQTNANICEKQVLAIGGLTRVKTTNTVSGLPIISKIPVLGDFFKRRKQTTEKSTLMVFVSPKLIKPRAGISKFVRGKLNEAMSNIKTDELAFDNLNDPITRILFKGQADESNELINNFAEQIVFGDAQDLKATQNTKTICGGPISGKIK